MFKKKTTKSFFDTEQTQARKFRPYQGRDKENRRPIADQSASTRGAVISDSTKTRLKTFVLPENSEAPATPLQQKKISLSENESEPVHLHSSQGQDRVRWKLSPFATQTGSAQKLTINEMFDIYQASQHSSQTPVRHLDPTNNLWSRYDSAEPLPYLDLDLSPASRKLPKTEASLRRTTSLPTWAVDCNGRKRRKVSLEHGQAESSDRVRVMLAQVQQALLNDNTPPTSKHTSPMKQRKDRTCGNGMHLSQSMSDDFGSDDLDEDLLLHLPDLQHPYMGSVSNAKLNTTLPTAKALPQVTKPLSEADPECMKSVLQIDGIHTVIQPLVAACQSPAGSSPPAKSPGIGSNYDLDFDEEEFLAATQALNNPPLTAISKPSRVVTEMTESALKDTRTPSNLSPAELLAGLEDEVFSDFEDSLSLEDTSLYVVTHVSTECYTRTDQQQSRQFLVLKHMSGGTKYARLEDDWAEMAIEIGDTLRFHGTWAASNSFLANSHHGLVIKHPDVLVSSTAVADAHICMRKSVLQDRVRATSKLSTAILYGSILHAILQKALAERDFSDKGIRDEIESQITINMEKLFLLDETIQSAKDYLYSKMLLLQQWATTFFEDNASGRVEPMRGSKNPQDLSVGVKRALDIEERFWSPSYGLKGNVDVTAELSIELESEHAVVIGPLEFKTGKTSYQQSSHRAQVMLYALMMSERYHINVTAGFLYYLETKQITRVAVLHNELRGLMLMRNELAGHIKNKTIPLMIRNKRLCSSCYASEACFVYHKATESGTGQSSGLDDLFEGKTNHLGERDLAFFRKWETLITKEEGEMFKYRNELWHLTSPERESVRRCFGNLQIIQGSERFDPTLGKQNQWTYEFSRTTLGTDFHGSQIIDREPIVVSDEDGRYAIACGFVTHVATDKITVLVDRPLRDSRSIMPDFDGVSNQVFRGTTEAAQRPNLLKYRIDRDEFKNGLGIVRNNLISLFLDPGSQNALPNTQRQRELIVDLVAPRFDATKGPQLHGTQTLMDLNSDQIRAKDKILAARDYALILGMPGTGKTTTIARIIRTLVAAGQSVLLTSYTHSAVDTILLKLAAYDIKVLRLGGYSKIHPDVATFARTERHDCKNFEDLHEYYNDSNVVATTCLSINHAIFEKRRFDYCIFDEASQATLPVCLGPLRFADKFILVGDHYQLPPLVKNVEARAQGLDVSLFKLLCETHPTAVVELQHQYRMNAEIMSVSNELIYNYRLTCGTTALQHKRLENVELALLKDIHRLGTPAHLACRDPCWIEYAIDPARSVVYFNTDAIPGADEVKSQDCITNGTEAAVVTHIVENLLKCGMCDVDIGVISPYRSQLAVLKDSLHRHPQVLIDTADKFQGRDKDCIIVSLVRSNANKQIGDLLKDWRRINVAFTRAKCKMIIIGSQRTLANDQLLNAFLHLVHRNNWAYDLPASCLESHTLQAAAARTTQLNDVHSQKPSGRRQMKVTTAGRKVILANNPVLRDLLNGL